MNRAQEIASKVSSYISEAVGEMAYGYVHEPGMYDKSELAADQRRAMKAYDPAGALADALYNDNDLVTSIAGDQIYDLVKGDKDLFNKVLDHMPRHINWDGLRRKR